MTTRKHGRRTAAAIALSSAFLVAPIAAYAQTTPNLPEGADPAHHSLDVSDPDPAHHRPVLVFSASTQTFSYVSLAGFDLAGRPLSSPDAGEPPADYSTDPAHHSTDLNDPDPAHHRPLWVDGKLVPIPGFDIFGYRLSAPSTGAAFS